MESGYDMAIVTVTLNPCIDKTFSVDHVIADRKLACADMHEYPGGGGINAARVATRLGGDARALWSCGGDTGRRLAQLLDAENVPHTPIPVEGRVRENLIITDASTGEQYRFGMPGPPLTEEERARWVERVRSLPSSVRYIVVSGSVPPGTPGKWYVELLHALPSRARVVVDTKRDALRRALDAGVYLIKPNVRELEEVAGRELPDDERIQEAAHEIIGRGGAEAVLVSLGRGGAILATAEAMERIHAPAVPVRSKVGAGDSTVGGLVTALDQGRPLAEAARFGVAAGAAAVMAPGTQLASREDAERLYRG